MPKDPMEQITSLFRFSPGLGLVILGFFAVYVSAIASSGETVSTTKIASISFGFFLAIAGIILLFKDLSREAYSPSEFNVAVEGSDIEHTVQQLGKNYDILRRQATQGFILSGTFMALGILVILAGSLGEMFGFASPSSNLTTIAGVIVEIISGLGLYMFNQTFNRLNSTSDKLYEMWKILAAFKKAETLPGQQQVEMKEKLIYRLIDSGRVSPP